LKNILSIIILSTITLTVFTLLTLKGGFPLVRAEVIAGSTTSDAGIEQTVNVIAFNGFHVLNMVYAALIAIFIGVVSRFGLAAMYETVITDIREREDANS